MRTSLCSLYTFLLLSLVDTRDGAKYTVQVMHSAAALLSMILVYGKDQRLLAMSHLIAADCLPSKDQLDHNLQFLPHLSSPGACAAFFPFAHYYIDRLQKSALWSL